MPYPARVVSLSAFLFLFGTGVAHAQSTWMSNGPEGGSILALAIHPSAPTTLYAGTFGGGVFKSTTGGGSWSPVNSEAHEHSCLRPRLARRGRTARTRGPSVRRGT